jgi:hypothetical protein
LQYIQLCSRKFDAREKKLRPFWFLNDLATQFNLHPLRVQSQKGKTNTKNVHTIASFSHHLFIYIYYLKDTNAAFSSPSSKYTLPRHPHPVHQRQSGLWLQAFSCIRFLPAFPGRFPPIDAVSWAANGPRVFPGGKNRQHLGWQWVVMWCRLNGVL